jgi:drug/metabolite transporter (DMT)-like permease
MDNVQQRTIRGVNIFKDNLLLFLFICLIASILSIYIIPFLLNGSVTDQQLNEGINQVGMTYGGALTFSTNDIINSLVSFFRLSILSTILVIIAYIVKYKIDKRIFKLSKWRDWKFFLYLSGVSLIAVDIFQNLTTKSGDNFILNLILTILSCFIIIIFSSIILTEELERIKL